jgi:DNA-directed RNA polymerase subunit RPC12/RpoP/type II secretory pathway pseudopilin PulG
MDKQVTPMLEFSCSTCGKRVQTDDWFADMKPVCQTCNNRMTALPATAIATPQDAAQAKITPPATTSSNGAFQEGWPLLPQYVAPPIHKEAPNLVLRWVPCVLSAVIIAILVGLLIPAVYKLRQARVRTESTNNLKNIALAFHGFHDANKRLPFNGTAAAIPGNNTTGSWAFQILPFIDQAPLFTQRPLNTTHGIRAYMCPGRDRPSVCTTGAWTDYFINTWVNDFARGSPSAVDFKRRLVHITDCTSYTIFVGHGNIDPMLYSSTVRMAQSSDIFGGGLPATARFTTTNQVDTANDQGLDWGGPFPQGALMGMGDATVRLFPFTITGGRITNGVSDGMAASPFEIALGPFLTPTGHDAPLFNKNNVRMPAW